MVTYRGRTVPAICYLREPGSLMTASVAGQAFCADQSLQAGEQLIGTAPQASVYILLEYADSWGEKALEDSDLVDAVKIHLKDYARENPAAKILLIKTERRYKDPGVRLFLCSAVDQGPALYAFRLTNYTDLLGLDFAAILAGAPGYQSFRSPQPLLLVCTNGRRDRCCSRYGSLAYKALVQATRDSLEPLVWQCTHIGGHRFAANVICLPHGLSYGRVDTESSQTLWSAYNQQQVYLPNLRGRTSYPPAAQIAEYHLRQQVGDISLEALHLVEVQATGEQRWQVRFLLVKSGEIRALEVNSQETERYAFESCRKDKRIRIKAHDVHVIPPNVIGDQIRYKDI